MTGSIRHLWTLAAILDLFACHSATGKMSRVAVTDLMSQTSGKIFELCPHYNQLEHTFSICPRVGGRGLVPCVVKKKQYYSPRSSMETRMCQ